MNDAAQLLLDWFASYGALLAAIMLGLTGLLFAADSLRGSTRIADARRRLHDTAGPAVAGGGVETVWGAMAPLAKRFGERLAPNDEKLRGDLRQRLRRAGFDKDVAPLFYSVRGALILALPLIAILVGTSIWPGLSAVYLLATAACAGGIGFILPSFLIDYRIGVVRQEMRTGFPDMLDLLVICMESGMSFEAGFDRVANEIATAYPRLHRQMTQAVLELRAGKDRSAALFAFAERIGLEEATTFANMIMQAEQLGSGVSQALRVCAEEMRDRRLIKAEEYANRLPVLLVLPLGLFIFPAILIVTLLPAGIAIYDTLIAQ